MIGDETTTDEDVILLAVGDVLKSRLAKMEPGAMRFDVRPQRYEFPAPVVKGPDMAPVGQAIDDLRNMLESLSPVNSVDTAPIAAILAQAIDKFADQWRVAAEGSKAAEERLVEVLDRLGETLQDSLREAVSKSLAEAGERQAAVLAAMQEDHARVMQAMVDRETASAARIEAMLTKLLKEVAAKRKDAEPQKRAPVVLKIEHDDGTVSTISEERT